jgi:hypothetical protein
VKSAKRNLRPRPVVSASPLMVSDQTSFDIVGLTGRHLRDFLAAHQDVPRTVLGQRVLVRAEVLVAALDRLGTGNASAGNAAADDDSISVESVLATVNRRRTG